ncbi:MAG: S-methyl-5'-thioinosine phosphorylase [Patescibacteria group bacterium]|nr:S-methyl-5'-thioinosine phosphorylase [Patescibacteria group bacterium]
MENINIGIIGGSGIYDLGLPFKKKSVKTPYSKKAVEVYVGDYKGIKIAFLNRHGKNHSVPPHLINYRANIFAFKKIGVKDILSVNAVGAISKLIKVGDFVVIDQFIDFTKIRPSTFFEGGKNGVVHTDMTNPFCEKLRIDILRAASDLKIKCINGGAIAVAEGPRYETAAEIRAYKIIGADVVGMTTSPEVVLARELNICYASICVVANYAAGISKKLLSHNEVIEVIKKREFDLKKIIFRFAELAGKR